MCFSATASFTASAALTINGFVGLYFAKKINRRFIPLHIMIFFYAIQQFSEGMIWLHVNWINPVVWGWIFLFFAFFVYAWYPAFACYFITNKKAKKKKIAWIVLGGLIYGSWAFANVLTAHDFSVTQCSAHISYNFNLIGGIKLNSPIVYAVIVPLYIMLTSAPFFISDRRYSSVFGGLIASSALICAVIYFNYFISVWCFYAAIIAIAITTWIFLRWHRQRIKIQKSIMRSVHK